MIIQKRYQVDPSRGGGRPRTERTREAETGETRTAERRETTHPRRRHPDPSGAVGRAEERLADLTGTGARRTAGAAAAGTIEWAREHKTRFDALRSEADTLIDRARATERRNPDDPSITADLRRAAGLIAEARGILGTVRGAFPDRGGVWQGEGTAHQTEIWNFSTNGEMLDRLGSELYQVATLHDAGRPSSEHIAQNLRSIYTGSGAASTSMPAGPRTP